MNGRSATAGRTRACPHCRATILESAAVCPSCRHHLRFDPKSQAGEQRTGEVALGIQGSFSHPPAGPPWEYSVVVVVRDAHGAEIARHVVNVGALAAGEQRGVELSVEVFKGEPDD